MAFVTLGVLAPLDDLGVLRTGRSEAPALAQPGPGGGLGSRSRSQSSPPAARCRVEAEGTAAYMNLEKPHTFSTRDVRPNSPHNADG